MMENGGVSLGWEYMLSQRPRYWEVWPLYGVVVSIYFVYWSVQRIRKMAVADNIHVSSLPLWKQPIGWFLYLFIKFWWIIPATIVLIFVYALVWGMITGLGGSL